MRSGCIYVLVHSSDPTLVKVGRTTQKLERRIAQHNSDFTKIAGQVVKETGQKWELKESIEVPDPVHAEAAFWGATGFADIAYRGGAEVERMDWRTVQAGLDAARKAGVRPPPKPRLVRNREWMLEQLEGTGISLIGRYRGLLTFAEFQCEAGHTFKESPGLVANIESCPLCPPRGAETSTDLLPHFRAVLSENPLGSSFSSRPSILGERVRNVFALLSEWAIRIAQPTSSPCRPCPTSGHRPTPSPASPR